jgi:hypothetical protein
MKQALLSLVRHILTAAGGAVIANNPSISENSVNLGIGALLAIVGASWGAYDEHKAAKQ